MFNKLKKLFHKKEKVDNLRTECIRMYGGEFGKIYDDINRGVSVGGFLEVTVYIHMIEEARKNLKYK